MRKSIFSRYWLLIAIVATSLLAYGGMVGLHLSTGTLRDGYTPNTLGWYALAFVAYLGALLGAERRQGFSFKLIWGGAVAFRVLLLFTTPTLSDDVYRYLWDGYVSNNGVSPYAYPIDSPALDALDTPERALANNRWMASPYLPAAQYLFAGLTWLFPPTPLAFQATMLILDLLNGLLLLKLLAVARLPGYRVLIYLWNPLVIVETAHGAHVDAWMIFLTLLALWLTFAGSTWMRGITALPREGRVKTRNRDRFGRAVWLIRAGFLPPPTPPAEGRADVSVLAGGIKRGADVTRVSRPRAAALATFHYLAPVALALATLTKGLPILLLPVLFWRWRWRQLALYGVVTVVLLLPAGLAAGWGLTGPLDGTGLFGALRIYSDQWNFNSGLFHWLESAFVNWGVVEAEQWAKMGVGTAMALAMLGVWLAARRVQTPRAALRLMAWPFMAYVLLTTTVHPWYLMILLAFLPFLPPDTAESPYRWLAVAPWVYLSGALALSYLTYLNPLDFRELAWVRRVEWWPTWGLVVIWIMKSRRLGAVKK